MTTFATGMSYAAIAAFALLLVGAALSDVKRYIISNRLNLAVAGSSVVFLLAQSLLPPDLRTINLSLLYIAKTVGAAALVFAVCLVLFAKGVMGGGDVKLITLCTLWAGPPLVLPFIFVTALAGGVVTLGVLVVERLKRLGVPASQIVNPLALRMSQSKVPYGLGIATGGLYVATALATQAGLGG
ncbi:MAG: hypothetical protein D6763_02625 [Alphaproteobacteria bacterium]|nr:MAG: hypothetical protein D6763_02625 [Alphaproteobacteria bacterium]